jgi:hypothetical protein
MSDPGKCLCGFATDHLERLIREHAEVSVRDSLNASTAITVISKSDGKEVQALVDPRASFE